MDIPIRTGLAVLALAFAADGRSQEPVAPPPVARPPARQAQPATLVTIDFAGGTLSELAAAIRDGAFRSDDPSAGKPFVNIVLPADAAEVAIPPTRIVAADAGNLLRAVAGSIQADVQLRVDSLPSAAGEPIHVVTMQGRSGGRTQPTVDLDFAGGSLAELAELLRTKAAERGQPASILLPAVAAEVRVPALRITDAQLDAALRAVAIVLEPGVQMEVQSSGGGPGAPVYSVQLRVDRSRGRTQMLRVFSLGQITRSSGRPGHAVPTALTAIETAVAFTGAQGDSVRYHEDSGLLFVRGTKEQVDVVAEVLAQLEHDVREMRRREAVPANVPTEVGPAGERRGDPPSKNR